MMKYSMRLPIAKQNPLNPTFVTFVSVFHGTLRARSVQIEARISTITIFSDLK